MIVPRGSEMRLLSWISLLVCVLIFAAAPDFAWAQRVGPTRYSAPTATYGARIAASVNDTVITTTDLEERYHLALIASGLPDNPEVREKLLPQILRSLIDEQLQAQEAKRLDVKVPRDDVEAAMARIAHDNNIQGNMADYVRAHGGSPTALFNQIQAGILWNRVVQRELRPKVEVGEDEIEAAVQRLHADMGKDEYLVSEIYLAVDNPKDENQIHQLADNLVRQIKAGANFSAIARQFSQGTGAATGGDIGWIREGQLAPEINRVLTGMDANKINGPIRSASGYHIIGVRDKRKIAMESGPEETTVALQQAFYPATTPDSRENALKDVARMRTTLHGCKDLSATLTGQYPGWKWQDLGKMVLEKAPFMMADQVKNVPEGGMSEPIATDKGALVLFVCSRQDNKGAYDREAVMNVIGSERLELQARRLQRDMRRNAVIKIYS